jgi:hypothetical protein
MTSHAIRKTTKRRAVQGSIEEDHEAAPRTEELNFVQPGVACNPLELERRASKLRLTSAERAHLSELWHRAGNGVFFDTLLARLAN